MAIVAAFDVTKAVEIIKGVETNGYATESERALCTVVLELVNQVDYLSSRISGLEKQIPLEVAG